MSSKLSKIILPEVQSTHGPPQFLSVLQYVGPHLPRLKTQSPLHFVPVGGRPDSVKFPVHFDPKSGTLTVDQ